MSALVDTAAWLLAQMASAIQYHTEAASHRCNERVLRISFSSFTPENVSLHGLENARATTSLQTIVLHDKCQWRRQRRRNPWGTTSCAGTQASQQIVRFTAFICYPHTRLRIGGHHIVQVCGKTNLVFPL
jgi:hypothetical protein